MRRDVIVDVETGSCNVLRLIFESSRDYHNRLNPIVVDDKIHISLQRWIR